MTANRDWHVRRTGGLLPPGFEKRFSEDGASGTTYFMGVPIGSFDVRAAGENEGVELVYRAWPIVDVLAHPPGDGDSIESTGNVSVGGRRLRFCRFRLER